MESDAEKQQCGYEGITESVSFAEKEKVETRKSRSVKTSGNVASILAPKFNVSWHWAIQNGPRTGVLVA